MASNGAPAALTAAAAQNNFEQAVALSLHTWPALTLSVQNNWGGEASSDKRDWFAGAVVDLFAPFEKVVNGVATPKDAAAAAEEEPDVEYVEEFLLQVMCDEFEVNIDDESGFDIAQAIIKFRTDCAKGKFDDLSELQRKWESKKGKKVEVAQGESPDQEVDDDDSDDYSDDDEDVNMDEAPQLVQVPKEKPAPEVDEDGFTTVSRKR
ncbi:Pre-rRNA-processing protein TSR2 like [Verticillium longisporum]|nr:Pre-rRNA-processing protein TSR2 like [Verticillium longisporum]